jgi:periplasmic protein TonB
MSLRDTHRSRLATQQNRWLVGYLGLAIGLHAAAAIGIARWNFLLLTQKNPQSPIPLDFVYLESLAQPAPVQATRQAQTNSTAGRQTQPNQPVQAGGTVRASAMPQTSVPPVSAVRSQPVRSQPSTAPQSQSSLQRNPSQPVPRTATAPQPVQPSPAEPSPVLSPIASEEPASSRATSGHATSGRESVGLQPASPAEQSTTVLGAPQTLSLEGIGLGSRPNANRSGSGTGMDATEDITWGSYLSGLNQLIDQHWQRVAVSATRRTRIQFRVDRQGQLTDWNVLESSGDRAADQAAIQAIRAAAPFAPLPQNATEEVLIVNFTFTQWLSPNASP